MKAIWMLMAITSLSVLTVSCGAKTDKDASQAQTQTQKVPVAVDVEIAKFDSLQAETGYTRIAVFR